MTTSTSSTVSLTSTNEVETVEMMELVIRKSYKRLDGKWVKQEKQVEERYFDVIVPPKAPGFVYAPQQYPSPNPVPYWGDHEWWQTPIRITS